MKILVTGGTGFVGSYLCRELRDRGHDVTALARHPESADVPDGVDAVAGDVAAYDSIEPAFEGMDAAVNLVALSPLFQPRGGNEMHDRVHRQGTENCVRAAEEHGVDRFVQQSALQADPDGPTAYIRAKGRAEEIVRNSDLEWTIFRPSVIFGDGGEFVPFTKKLAPPYLAPLPGGGKTRFQPIWIGDFAPMVADAVEDDEHLGEVYEIGGPAAFTLAEIARLAHRADGRPTTVLPIPMALAGVGLTVAGAIPGVPMGADQYRSLTFDNTTADNDIDAFGVTESDLRSLEDYLGVE
jgi:NADH dehydrogenase